MYINTDLELPAQQMNYLLARLTNLSYTKASELRKDFGLTDDPFPETPKELLARITEGKYVLPKESEDKSSFCPLDYIRWRDPAKLEDKEGYKAADKLFQVDYTTTKDQIWVKDLDTGLKALQDFEAKKYN